MSGGLSNGSSYCVRGRMTPVPLLAFFCDSEGMDVCLLQRVQSQCWSFHKLCDLNLSGLEPFYLEIVSDPTS